MTASTRLAINNRGDWVARVSRTNGDVVVRNGVILVDNNTPEITNNSIYSFSINNNGDAVSIVYRKDAKVGDFSNGRQVYLNSQVLVTGGFDGVDLSLDSLSSAELFDADGYNEAAIITIINTLLLD